MTNYGAKIFSVLYEMQIYQNTLMAKGYKVHFVTKIHYFVDFFQSNDLFKHICIENKLKCYQLPFGKLLLKINSE